MFEALIEVVETYGGTFDKPLLVILQLAKNGFVEGANRDVLGASNPAQNAAAKVTVAESMKVAIFLDWGNDQNYKQLKYDLEKGLSKGVENYPNHSGTCRSTPEHIHNQY